MCRAVAAGFALTLLSGAGLPALATTRTVTSINDDRGTNTLRRIINASVAGDTINFSVTGTIVLIDNGFDPETGQLQIYRSINIIGPGATNLTISGNNTHRVFEFMAGTTNTLSGLTISDGRESGADGSDLYVTCPGPVGVVQHPTVGGDGIGGGILNSGDLVVSNCVLIGNVATGGAGGSGRNRRTGTICGSPAGLYTAAGAAGGDGKGGAIFNGGTVGLWNCTFSSNSASGGPGGSGGHEFSSPNWPDIGPYPGAQGGSALGGAIYSTGLVRVVNCTLACNTVAGGGGGEGGYSQTSRRSANGGDGGSADGGALAIFAVRFLTSCTIISNSVAGGSGGNAGQGALSGTNGLDGAALGGGVYVSTSDGFIRNTIIAGNSGTAPDVSSPNIGSGGFNLIGMTDGSSGWISSDLTGSILFPLDPHLGPLQLNGGATPTMALLEGSAAIDHGNSGGSDDPHTDQRGFTRPVDLLDAIYPNASGGDGADIGAYEVPPFSRVPVTLPATQITSSNATLNGTVNPVGLATTIWFEWGATTGYGNTTRSPNPRSGYSNISISDTLAGLLPGITYHFRAVANSFAGKFYGPDLTFTTLPTPPTVSTLSASQISGSGATLNGTVNPGGAATTVWFEYGLTTSYGSSTATTNVGTGNSPIPASAAVTGFTFGATYHYRVVASNAVGAIYGSDLALTALPPPILITLPADQLSSSGATLNGTVNPNGAVASVWFEWGSTTSYGFSTLAVNIGSGNVAVPASERITGLTSGATYHFRIVASNGGSIVYGSDVALTALPPLSMGTTPATLVTSNSATLNGWLNPYGAAASYWFQWGENTGYGHDTPLTYIDPVSGVVPISAGIIYLTVGQIYHFRVAAATDDVIVYSSDQSFTAGVPPSAATLAATLVTGSSATLNGSVNPKGLATTTWFEYGLDSSYGSVTVATSAGSGGSAVPASAPVSGLSSGVTYHFRSVASNAVGTAYGGDLTFAAVPPPSAVTLAATLVTSISATLNGSANPNGRTTTTWFEYGLTTSYGNSTTATGIGSGNSVLPTGAGLSGLSPGATYHYRTVASNGGGGVSYGNDATFMTLSGAALVWTLADSGAGSLRDAIAQGTGNPITFSNGLTGTITLTNGELLVNRNVTILGPGASVLTVSGNNSSRVFHIAGGITSALSGLGIARGRSAGADYAGGPGSGGGILNEGSLTLSNCLLSGNVAVGGQGVDGGSGAPNPGGLGGSAQGGAIFNGGSLWVFGCAFRTNGATGGIGGTGSYGYANLSGGVGGVGGFGSGGAVYGAGAVQLVNSTFWGNTASGGRGGSGGRDVDYVSPGGGGVGGVGSGAAIEIAVVGLATMTNCTLSGNPAMPGAGGPGGVDDYYDEDVGAVVVAAVGSNGAAGSALGGGLRNSSSLGGILNTIIAGNTGGASPDVNGAMTSLGHNLIGATNGSSGWRASDLKGSVATPTNALLGPLQDNGGPTPTLALLPGSRAIDAGDDTATNSLATDQRGLLRLYGIHVDIGAYEAQPARPALAVTHSGNSVTISWPSSSTGFVLMQNTNLAAANWVIAPQTPADNGTTKTVTVTPSGQLFYRLKQ